VSDVSTNPTTPELVKRGADLFARAEIALREASEALVALRTIFAQAYANGDLKGSTAVQLEASALALAGEVGQLRVEVVDFHVTCWGYAQAAGVDVATPLAELPALSAGVVHTDGDGR